ncbi:MAG: signal recognition particle protein [Methanobacteriota archaeon]|nr:MAG: signal recognition particle protein [Euryarchaeota archaeon]
MVLDKLSDSLTGVIKKITRAPFIDEKLVKEVVRDIQRSLLVSDVNVRLVMDLSKRIEERALQQKAIAGLTKKEHVIKVVYEELISLLGEKQDYHLPTKTRVMLIGIQGSGKTTTSVKLAKFFSKKGLRPFIIAADTYRPAAYDQLLQLAEKANVKVYGEPEGKDPVKIVESGLEKAAHADAVILDTAGRHKSEEELFREMKELAQRFRPDEKLLVIDSNLGQSAGKQAAAFHKAIGLTGVVLTKLDGSAKGGGALSAVAETGTKIRFVGLGEGIDDLEIFDPERFVSRILGLGDLRGLMERAQEHVDEEKVRDILKGDLTLDALRDQIKAIRNMGPLGNILKMIPGFSMMSMPEGATEMTEEKMDRFLYIIDSMSRKERADPKILNAHRINRIARGSGTSREEVKELLNYHRTMKKALKGFKKGRFKGPLAKMMRGMR